MNDLGITYSSFLPFYGEKSIPLLKELGYTAVDFGLWKEEDPVFHVSKEEAVDFILKTKKAFQEAGIRVSQTHGPWVWPTQDATSEMREIRFKKMVLALELTSLLDCKNMVIHPIMPFGDENDPNPEASWSINKEFFGRLLVFAEKFNVNLCLENVPSRALSLASGESVLRFIRELNQPYFKFCLDTGHALITGEKPEALVKEAGDLLAALHIHDNHGQRDEHLWPTQGIIDWPAFMNALKEKHFQGALSLETGVVSDLKGDARIPLEKDLMKVLQSLAMMK